MLSRRFVYLAMAAGAALLAVLYLPTVRAPDTSLRPEYRSDQAQAEPPEASSGNPYRRRWHAGPTDRLFTLGAGDASLLDVVDVVTDLEGSIYALDHGALKIRKFDAKGDILLDYGRGEGMGPGELLGPTDFLVRSNGEVWVLDTGQGRIQVFEPDGSPSRVIPVEVPALRIAGIHHGQRYILHSVRGFLFSVYDSVGSYLDSFGRLVDRQMENGLAFQGAVATDDAHLVFAPLRAGYLASYTLDGERRFYTETVDRSPYPELIQNPDGSIQLSREDRTIINRDVEIVEDEIFVLARISDADRAEAVDVYDLHRGEYKYSFPFSDQSVRRIHVRMRGQPPYLYLYAVHDTMVSVWRR